MTNMVKVDLQGLKVLNPRPRHQAAALSRMIHAAGGIAVELPTLEIESLATDWLTTLPVLSTLQNAIFVSSNAVTHFFAGLHSQSMAWPDTIRSFTIGKGTAAALAQQKVMQITTPEHADSEHLLALPALQDIQGQSVLLVTGEKSRPLLSTTLSKRGADVQNIAVYRRARPKKNLQFTRALWQDDAVDIILMLSQEAIENLFVLFEEGARNWLQSKPWIVISPRLVDIAHRYHVKTVLLSPYNDIVTTLMGLRMSMDEIPNNITHTPPPFSDEQQTQRPEPKFGYSLRFGGIAAITACAAVLASLASITYQHLHPATQSPAPVITPSNPSNPPWQDIQAQIQELHSSQQALSQQTASNQQKIQLLIQAQPPQTQNWDLEKARYYLELAQINAQWSHNPASTIQLLQTADHILAQSNHPNLATIRHAIEQDLTAVEAIPTISTPEILDKINRISQQVQQLSLHPVAAITSNPIPQPTEPTTWQDNLYDNMQQLRGLISIQHHDEAWLPLRPDTIALLRENIRMNLQQAQLGLIEQHQALFTSALQAASDSISASFDPNNSKTQALIQALQALKTTKVAYSIPPLHAYAQLFEQNFVEPNSESVSTTKGSS